MGFLLKSEKIFSSLELSSFSIILIATNVEKGGKLSWSLFKLLAISTGIKSGLVDKSCPNLIKIVPASSKAFLIL